MRTSTRSRNTKALGTAAERRASFYYLLRGYRIVARNARAAGNEIDLIVRRGRKLAFCEVKLKSGDRYGDPAEMVGWEKQRRIRRAAETWLASRPELRELEISFEVVAIGPHGLRRIRNAF